MSLPVDKYGVIHVDDPNDNSRYTKPQPLPIKNDQPSIQDLVIADIQARKATGIRKYGTTLQAFNGRDALVDAYQESLDLCQYLRQLLEERDNASVRDRG